MSTRASRSRTQQPQSSQMSLYTSRSPKCSSCNRLRLHTCLRRHPLSQAFESMAHCVYHTPNCCPFFNSLHPNDIRNGIQTVFLGPLETDHDKLERQKCRSCNRASVHRCCCLRNPETPEFGLRAPPKFIPGYHCEYHTPRRCSLFAIISDYIRANRAPSHGP